MIGPVSGTGRAMMASLQQAIQKGMPPDQAIQYVKSMATQGVAPLTDLYSMMNQFQRLKQQQVKPPQTPPTIRDELNMMDQQQQMQRQMQQGNIQQMQAPVPAGQPMDRGLGAIDAGMMQYPQFAGGGMVSFAGGGDVVAFKNRGVTDSSAGATDIDSIEDQILRRYVPSYDTLPPDQQDVIKSQLAPQIEAAKSSMMSSTSPFAATGPTSKVPTLGEQRAAAYERANRPLQGYEAEIAAKAAAAGEGKAAEQMRTKIQERLEGLDKGDKRSRAIALTQLGAQIMQAASQPGATALGSIGAGLAKGLPMFEELQQRQQALKERYEDRIFELQRADELRKSGYTKEAMQLQREAQGDLRAIERASAENELAMERIRYQETKDTERENIRAGARSKTDEARARAVRTAIIDKTKKRLTTVGSMDPGAREYQKAQRDLTKARNLKDSDAIAAAEAALSNILQREIASEMQDYQIQGGLSMNPNDPLGMFPEAE
jgi:hypothetical protein